MQCTTTQRSAQSTHSADRWKTAEARLSQHRLGNGLTRGQTAMYQEWLDRAQKRYLAALKTLAQVRALKLPAVQLNVAQHQLNVAAPAALGQTRGATSA